jgi:hypothetical protein
MAGREPEGFETETEVTPEMLEAYEQTQPAGETENESEYWRRYRALRRNRFRRPGRRRRGLFGRRRFGGFGTRVGGGFYGGFGTTPPSDDSDTGDSDDDDGQGEVRRYYTRGGYRYPAYRYGSGYRDGSAYRPAFRYGYGRTYWGRRYPYGGRAPHAGRYYYRGGRYWPYRRSYGAAPYAPSAYRRWPWLSRRYYGGYRAPYYASQTAPLVPGPGEPMAGGRPEGSPWILLVQGCLRRLFGPGTTPSDGVLGPETRRALRAFQRQNGLPPSGQLDNPTVQALQGACMGGAAGAAPPPAEPAAAPPPDAGGAPPPAPPAAEPAAGGEPPADAGAAPPDGAAPADGAAGADAPPADGQGEITLGRREGESEQEFLVDGPMQMSVDRHEAVPLDRDPLFSFLPDAPGLYVIFVNGAPWYVGIAEGSLRNRFLQRRKILHDLQVPASALANRSVGWYLLRYSSAPKGAIQRRPQNNQMASFRPVLGKYAALRILEQVYIKRLRYPGGNKTTEAVQFGPRGSLVVTENGVEVSEYQPNSRV